MNDYPYPGIRPFKRDETHIFFGRETQTDALIARLGETRFLAVVGPSGCGKSSLVRTGMIAGLETGFLARAGAAWRVAEMRPGTAPFQNLAKALAAVYGPEPLPDAEKPDPQTDPAPSPENTDSAPTTAPSGDSPTEKSYGPSADAIQTAIQASSLGLHRFLAAHPLPENENLLIVADQFEELFRYADNDEAKAEAAAFVALLLAGSQPYPLPDGRISNRIYVVITMRSDFIGDCARFPGFAEAVNAGLYLTPRLTREQLREAIAEPPLVTGCEIEPALVARLLADVEDDPDQLPLLQHVLQWMWVGAVEANGEEPLLALADYENLGGFGQALSDRLDGIYGKLSGEDQKIGQILFRNLSKRDLEQRDIRRPVRLKTVAELAGVEPGAVRKVVEEFRRDNRNFFVISDNADDPDDPLLDVCHESLLRQWKTLKEWLAEEAESGAMYRRLEEAALRWKVGGDLWREVELSNALAWEGEFQPTQLWAARYGGDGGAHFDSVKVFLKKSREAEEKALREQEELIERLRKSEAAAIKAKARIEKVEKERTRDLFESYLTHASLQAKIEDYAAAQKILDESREIDAEIPATRRHARDLLRWYAELMSGGTPELANGTAGAPLLDVAVSPDGKLLAAVGEKGTALLFNTIDGGIFRPLKGHRVCDNSSECSVRTVVFDPEGEWLATAGDDRRILFWSVADGEKIREIQAPEKVGGLAVSRDGKTIAAGCDDRKINFWDIETGQIIQPMEGHGELVLGIAFSRDGTKLASASFDHKAMIWDVKKRTKLHTLTGHTGRVQDVAFHPAGHIVATASSDRTVILWKVDSGQPVNFLRGHGNIVHGVTFTESGDRLISASRDHTIRVWDTETGVNLRVLQGHDHTITSLVLKSQALFSASNDGTLRRWNLGPDTLMRVVDVEAEPNSAMVSPDGKSVAVGFMDGGLRLYSLGEMEEIWSKENAHNDRTIRIAYSPSGEYLVTASFDRTAKLWRSENGEPVQTFGDHAKTVYGADFSNDGRFIATASYDENIRLFEIGGGEELFAGQQGEVNSVTFSSIGKELLTTGDDGTVKLWDISSRPPVIKVEFPSSKDQMMWATISPDGTRVAAVGRDALVHIFDAAEGTEIHCFPGHEYMIFRAAFSPDGRQLATVSGDATIRFWDLESKENLFTLKLPTIGGNNPVPLWDFSFRCTPTGCWIVVPLTCRKVVVYRMDNFYGDL